MIAQPKLPVNSAYGATAVKERRKTVSAVFRRSCLLHSTRTAYGIAPALCNFAVATYMRCMEAKRGETLIGEAEVVSQPTCGAWRQSGLGRAADKAKHVATYTRCVETKAMSVLIDCNKNIIIEGRKAVSSPRLKLWVSTA